MTLNKPSTGNLYSSNFGQTVTNAAAITTINDDQLPQSPPIVYGELSILGYNGYIPNAERNGRKNKSKFLLRKRPSANGIKKSRHYIVKQPQATKAVQDKDLHSISYTFSRSQTIIVEYRQDENTDMFQIGRSSEDPIDFVVLDTLTINTYTEPIANNSSSSRDHHGSRSNQHNEMAANSNNQQQQLMSNNNGLIGLDRFHRHLAKVNGVEVLHYTSPPPAHDSRIRLQHFHPHHVAAQALLLNYPQPNISNVPQLMSEYLDSYHHNHNHHYNNNHSGHSSGFQQIQSANSRPNVSNHNDNQPSDQPNSTRHNANICPKRSHATQSTISRFACRILVDRKPPYTARIYAAGFDSSKNIFLGEKATKWEQNDSIDGLTTNGVLLLHPKQKEFYKDAETNEYEQQKTRRTTNEIIDHPKSGRSKSSGDIMIKKDSSQDHNLNNQSVKGNVIGESSNNINMDVSEQYNEEDNFFSANSVSNNQDFIMQSDRSPQADNADTNNNSNDDCTNKIVSGQDNLTRADHANLGGVWREVSVDGGIYAVRESRSAAQKGTRIEDETNVLQDGTLIDLCGATLLWRSVEGFKASPTKKLLEEKIDMLNATRPQCPVGLNTLVIPRKPIPPPNNHQQHHHRGGYKDHNHHHHSHHNNSKDSDKSSHQPYVYLKCGHVQGYHDWGTTDKSNQRTCPICLSVGTVAKLSMGLEPSFYVDSGPLTHVFNPCGHMASEKTVKYWCSVKIPQGTHFFYSICPFCSTPLATVEPPNTKLIFQDDLD